MVTFFINRATIAILNKLSINADKRCLLLGMTLKGKILLVDKKKTVLEAGNLVFFIRRAIKFNMQLVLCLPALGQSVHHTPYILTVSIYLIILRRRIVYRRP